MQKSSSNREPPITIEVVYALAHEQAVLALELPAGSTVGEALIESRLALRYPELDLRRAKVGIYGRVVSPETVLKEGDRVEIYRPLSADPKQARRRRAARPT